MNNLDVMNEALQVLGNMHKWKFLTRPAVPLNLVADQAYITLPADLYTMLGPPIPTSTSNQTIELVSMPELEQARRDSYAGTPYKACVVFNGNPPVARLEIVPTPTTSTLEAFVQPYRAGMRELTSEDQPIPMPVWMRPLFRAVCLAVKQGYEESDVAGIGTRLQSPDVQALFVGAVNRDSALQTRITRAKPFNHVWDESAVYLTGTVTGPQE